MNCSLFILSLHALALHLAVKCYLNLSVYEDLSTLTIHLSDIFPPECQPGPHIATNTISKNIPNI